MASEFWTSIFTIVHSIEWSSIIAYLDGNVGQFRWFVTQSPSKILWLQGGWPLTSSSNKGGCLMQAPARLTVDLQLRVSCSNVNPNSSFIYLLHFFSPSNLKNKHLPAVYQNKCILFNLTTEDFWSCKLGTDFGSGCCYPTQAVRAVWVPTSTEAITISFFFHPLHSFQHYKLFCMMHTPKHPESAHQCDVLHVVWLSMPTRNVVWNFYYFNSRLICQDILCDHVR